MLKAYIYVSTTVFVCFHITQKVKKEAFNPILGG